LTDSKFINTIKLDKKKWELGAASEHLILLPNGLCQSYFLVRLTMRYFSTLLMKIYSFSLALVVRILVNIVQL